MGEASRGGRQFLSGAQSRPCGQDSDTVVVVPQGREHLAWWSISSDGLAPGWRGASSVPGARGRMVRRQRRWTRFSPEPPMAQLRSSPSESIRWAASATSNVPSLFHASTHFARNPVSIRTVRGLSSRRLRSAGVARLELEVSRLALFPGHLPSPGRGRPPDRRPRATGSYPSGGRPGPHLRRCAPPVQGPRLEKQDFKRAPRTSSRNRAADASPSASVTARESPPPREVRSGPRTNRCQSTSPRSSRGTRLAP